MRHASARVIAAIASVEVPLGQWTELMPFLEQTCTSPNVAHREVGSYILFTVLENIVEGFESYMESLFRLFGQLIADPESLEVRIAAVRCVRNPYQIQCGCLLDTRIDHWVSLHSILMQMTRMKSCVFMSPNNVIHPTDFVR